MQDSAFTNPAPDVDAIIAENLRRTAVMEAPFNPVTGEGSIGNRQPVSIPGHPDGTLWLPEPMIADPRAARFLDDPRGLTSPAAVDAFNRLRCLHDFPYWAATYVYIKQKGGGEDVLFRLTLPQRRFVERIEQFRLEGKPVRIVLLKARQWGGSTTSQLYMAWLQLVHMTGLNSLIIAHQGTASDEIRDMFDRMIKAYPTDMLVSPGDDIPPPKKKTENVGRSGNTFRVIARNCKVKIGTAERPDSCRGGDYNLVHLSEVGIWKATNGKKPEDIVRSACSGVLYKPGTMIVYESTANGVGNFFHREYIDARDNPMSQFRSMFISWFDIPQNRLPFAADAERRAFAERLLLMRESRLVPSSREEPGAYLWWLWEKGATLEGINWYVMERAKHMQHGSMAAECPSDDNEAFVNSGAAVFDKYKVEALRADCREPLLRGEICSPAADTGVMALRDLRFVPEPGGLLAMWIDPAETRENIRDRYLVVVDIGGRSRTADWSVICVFDRLPMACGDPPQVVAQWRGHLDMDLLAWKAASIAAFFNDALLVIESNTLETRDRDREVDGDQSHYILNSIRRVYPNLYMRGRSPEEVRDARPARYGFHTNVSTKPMIISTLIRMVREHLYIERDGMCLDEMLVYERRANGSYGAIPGAHDDLVMTRAIGLHICFHEMPLPVATASTHACPNYRLSKGNIPISEASF